jgi:hypothetical protein
MKFVLNYILKSRDANHPNISLIILVNSRYVPYELNNLSNPAISRIK